MDKWKVWKDRTAFLQGEEAYSWFLREWYCDDCLLPTKKWVRGRDYVDYGVGIAVFGAFDERNCMYGFLCQRCAEKRYA